ncbi:DNA replication and repair protein RadC [Salsuginibacillus halophilus]|uniref:DNA replication and repair protein RadC n=1 Tax=Salsuginibacillus halophilus TaxID=517424 RepID=A0A2P8HCX4_9BACI|nr:DNA repair protein RadC [Salsuginibacillus halophilus]PSL43971.1 DNA replication and repair protein RadC [Salsuginibacillus halophilus]
MNSSEPFLIRDVPASERPRERMLNVGASKLTNAELVALLLRTGSKSESVLQLAQRVLQKFNGLELIGDATIEELQTISGIGRAKAVELQAAIELGRRIQNFQSPAPYFIRTPDDAASLVMEDMRSLRQEHFVTLCLNTKNQVIHRETLFVGGLNTSIVHPREVFKEALRRSAASIICLHNHPSGDPGPSREDIEVTNRLVSCGHLLGIEVLDHLIIGNRTFTSLKEEGHM